MGPAGGRVLGNDFAAEIVAVRILGGQQVGEDGLFEDVDAHGRDVGLVLGLRGGQAQGGRVDLHGRQRVALGLFREFDDLAGRVHLHQAEIGRPLRVDGQAADGDVRPRRPVVLHKLGVIHAVPIFFFN